MKLYRKDRVTCPKGGHLLREYRLAPDSGTRRVVAVCCNSPMFLDFTPGHWLSLFSKRWPAGEQDTVDVRTMLGDCPSPINFSDEIPSHKSHSLLFFAKLISAWAAMGFRRPAFDYGYQKLEMWGIQRNWQRWASITPALHRSPALSRQKASEDAGEALDDPFAIDFIDDREDYGEDRFILLGIVNSRLLVVAHTLRDDRARIVSACVSL
jgi:hypothetical protein